MAMRFGAAFQNAPVSAPTNRQNYSMKKTERLMAAQTLKGRRSNHAKTREHRAASARSSFLQGQVGSDTQSGLGLEQDDDVEREHQGRAVRPAKEKMRQIINVNAALA